MTETRYISLHTGDPSAGDQTTNEADYTGYVRVAIRAGDWKADFPVGCGADCVATHFAIGTARYGPGEKIFHNGPLHPTLHCGAGIVPRVYFARGPKPPARSWSAKLRDMFMPATEPEPGDFWDYDHE